jgi:hypothetical protein
VQEELRQQYLRARLAARRHNRNLVAPALDRAARPVDVTGLGDLVEPECGDVGCPRNELQLLVFPYEQTSAASVAMSQVPILLQKSDVASVRIFGETLKHEAADDLYNLSRATEIAYEISVRP